MSIKTWNASFIMLEALIIFVYFNPIADLFPSYIQIGIFILWLLFNLMEHSKFWREAISISILNIIIFIFTFFRCVIADQLNMGYYSTLQVVIERYQLVVYTILFVYVKHLSLLEKRRIVILAFSCIVGTILVSLYYIFFLDPQAIRNTQRAVPLLGVGDFMLMYSIAILIGPLLFLIIERIKYKKKIKLLVVTFILMLICLILCNLVTSVVIALASVLITYIVRQKNKMFVISFCCLLATLTKNFFAKLLYYIATKEIFYWSTNNKIIAIANVLSVNLTHLDTLSLRCMLAGWSLQSFQDNPLLGINWRSHEYGKIGCHMQWIDDLGRYGIIGNIILIINYICIIRYTVRSVDDVFTKKALISAWITLCILGCLNPCLSATNLMMIFIIIPSLESLFPIKNWRRSR